MLPTSSLSSEEAGDRGAAARAGVEVEVVHQLLDGDEALAHASLRLVRSGPDLVQLARLDARALVRCHDLQGGAAVVPGGFQLHVALAAVEDDVAGELRDRGRDLDRGELR